MVDCHTRGRASKRTEADRRYRLASAQSVMQRSFISTTPLRAWQGYFEQSIPSQIFRINLTRIPTLRPLANSLATRYFQSWFAWFAGGHMAVLWLRCFLLFALRQRNLCYGPGFRWPYAPYKCSVASDLQKGFWGLWLVGRFGYCLWSVIGDLDMSTMAALHLMWLELHATWQKKSDWL